MPGPPLSQESAIVHLLSQNVMVGVGVMGIQLDPGTSTWAARNARFDISWVRFELKILQTPRKTYVLIREGRH